MKHARVHKHSLIAILGSSLLVLRGHPPHKDGHRDRHRDRHSHGDRDSDPDGHRDRDGQP
jgi:hypothetical protein